MAKCKYDPKTFPALVEGYARDGMIEKDIAKKLGVSVATFETYKTRFPEVLASLKKGKAPIDFEVENALLKRAMGYETREEKIIKDVVKNPDGSIKSEGSARVEITKKIVPPDTTACIFWLKNRKPAEWRDKRDIEVSGEIDQTVFILPAKRPIIEIPDGSVRKEELKDRT